jgi:hypothetical protein
MVGAQFKDVVPSDANARPRLEIILGFLWPGRTDTSYERLTETDTQYITVTLRSPSYRPN